MRRQRIAVLIAVATAFGTGAAPAAPADPFPSEVKDFLEKGRVQGPALPASDASVVARNGFVAEAVSLFFPDLPAGGVPSVYQGSDGAPRPAAARVSRDAAGAVPASYRSEGPPAASDLDRDIRLSPSTNRAREQTVVELFRRAGAEEVYTQPIGRTGQNNIVVVKPGTSDRIIVIGAHHDKVGAGRGTIDNWTGAMMVTNLYKAFKDAPTDHTLVFVTFGAEESGLVGSRQFVSELSRTARGRVDAMVNFDCLGVPGGPQLVENGSSQMLASLARQVARRNGHELGSFQMSGGTSDHESFLDAGIPALSFSGDRLDMIHSQADDPGAFSLPDYEKAFNLSVDVMKALDRPASEGQGRGAQTGGRQQSRSLGPARDGPSAVVGPGRAVGQYALRGEA